MKAIPVRTYYIATCDPCGRRIVDPATKSPYNATLAKAERISQEHALKKHVVIAPKKVRIKRTTSMEVIEEIAS